jgi:hypothetical protein
MRNNMDRDGGDASDATMKKIYVQHNHPELFEKFGEVVDDADDQLWALCVGVEDAKVTFAGWGAEVIHFTEEVEGYHRFMVRMEGDGMWHYAHTNGTSCYVSVTKAYRAGTGEVANLMRKHDVTVTALEAGLQAVAALLEDIMELKKAVGGLGGKDGKEGGK